MPRGTLQRAFNDKGFSFIGLDPPGASKPVFLHIRALAPGQDARLFVAGATVDFDVVLVASGSVERPQARNVVLVPEAVPSSAFREGTVKFWTPRSFGFVKDQRTEEEFYVSAASVPGGYLRDGDVVRFQVETRTGRQSATNVSVVSWNANGIDPFNDLIDMGNPAWVKALAWPTGPAEKEPGDWNYLDKPSSEPYPILRSYLKYTFLRLNELPGHLVVSSDETHLAFNTGLVTPFQEELFAVFTRRDPKGIGPPWLLRGFEKASSVSYLRMFGGRVPPLAWYYKDPAELVYNTSFPLVVNVEHVPHDPERFGGALSSMAPADIAGLVNARAPEALDRVRRNYKTAIPQFYRDGKTHEGKMQLLLPVALLSRDRIELALAVDLLDSVYLGRTVLKLDWAYNNARLLTRPDTDWLRP